MAQFSIVATYMRTLADRLRAHDFGEWIPYVKAQALLDETLRMTGTVGTEMAQAASKQANYVAASYMRQAFESAVSVYQGPLDDALTVIRQAHATQSQYVKTFPIIQACVASLRGTAIAVEALAGMDQSDSFFASTFARVAGAVGKFGQVADGVLDVAVAIPKAIKESVEGAAWATKWLVLGVGGLAFYWYVLKPKKSAA